MADIRINSLPTTASASSSDDFLALDGATNGTRKLNAYSPTFGGNLTVSGTGTNSFAGNITSTKNLDSLITETDYGLRVSNTAGDGGLYIGANSTVSVIQSIDPGTTFDRKLAINPTGGNVLVGTTTDGGQKLQVAGNAYISSTLTVNDIIRSSGATNTIRVRGNSQLIDFTNLAESAYVTGTIIANTLNLHGNNGTGLSIGTTGDATFAGNVKVSKAGTTTLGNSAFLRLDDTTAGLNRTEIGFGYKASTYQPVVAGYISTSSNGNTRGNFYIATRDSDSDIAPTVRFSVAADGKINMASLPTSSAGLSAGDIWNDGGTLKIV